MLKDISMHRPIWVIFDGAKYLVSCRCATQRRRSNIAEYRVVMLCGWGVKAGWLIPFVDASVGGRYNCVILVKSDIPECLIIIIIQHLYSAIVSYAGCRGAA